MESFADYVSRFIVLLGKLCAARDNLAEWKMYARLICRSSRDIEFAVPRERVYDPATLTKVAGKFAEAIAELSQYPSAKDDPNVLLYREHLESRRDYLLRRAGASLNAGSEDRETARR